MLDRLRGRYYATRRRVRRFERRERREGRQWVEHTHNLVHLSVLVFVPLLVGVVTWLSGAIPELSFLLFPPLASGTYMLFSDPQGRHSSPWRFVAGLTTGALCGWGALEISATFIHHVPPSEFEVAPTGAALAVLFTAIATWALDVEEPSAFSTALLVLITGASRFGYVLTVIVSSTVVAVVFVAWRELFYEQRAEYLYRSIDGDDQVLVPVRGDTPERAAMLGANLASSHATGRVVLLDVVPESALEDEADETRSAARARSASGGEPTDAGATMGSTTTELRLTAEHAVAKRRLERIARIERRIEDELGVPCETTIAVEQSTGADTALQVARETECDLIVAPYVDDNGDGAYARHLFSGSIDTIVFRSACERERWRRVLVPVRRAGDVAHSMLNFARRLAGDDGWVSTCTCIDRETERRSAERMLADLAETVDGACETHVAQAAIEDYLTERAPAYDLVIMGASTDRSAASRFLSTPTAKRVRDIDCDVAVVHRG